MSGLKWMVWGGLALLLVACGDSGEESTLDCGPGTVQEGQQCVPDGGDGNNDTNNDVNNDQNNDTGNNDVNNDDNNGNTISGDCADNDDNEPNDSPQEASAFGGGAQSDFVGLCAQDEDWFAVGTGQSGQTLLVIVEAIAIEGGNPTADIVVEAFDDQENLLAQAAVVDGNLEIEHPLGADTEVLVKVQYADANGDGFIYDFDAVFVDP